MLTLGFHLENFLEGYAKITLGFTDIISKLRREEPVIIMNVNSGVIDLEKIVESLFTNLARNNIYIYDLREYVPIIPVVLEDFITGLISDKFTVIGWRPYLPLSLLLNKHKRCVLLAYSRNVVNNVIKYKRKIFGTKTLVVLNPFHNAEVDNIGFAKVYPPIHKQFFEAGSSVLRDKPQQDFVVFRLMGRFHRSRGVVEALRSFKKFKTQRPDAKARLVIDTFSESVQKDFRLIGTGIEIRVWNPLKHVRIGSLSPRRVVDTVIGKYVCSSYIVLPYRFRQFIEPPLTLLEALATGSFVVTTDLLRSFIGDKDVALMVNSKNIVKELVNTFEYLYETHDSSYYWATRRKAFEYARKTFSYEAVTRTLGDILNRYAQL